MGAPAVPHELIGSRWPSAKSWSPSLSMSVRDVIEMHFDVSLKVPIQCVVKGNFMSMGAVCFMKPAGGVGPAPGSEQPPMGGPPPSVMLDPPVAPEATVLPDPVEP